MQRYKFVWPKGHGYECDLSTDEPFMALKTDGYWTEYDGAAKRAITEFNRGRDSGYDIGLDQGRKEGQVKVDAIKDMNQAELTAEYNRGYHDGFMVWSTTGRPVQDLPLHVNDVPVSPGKFSQDYWNGFGAGSRDKEVTESKRTQQLLNELYHDRARLEKVVADIASTARHTAADIATLMEELYPDGVANMTQATVDMTIDGGMLKQFADTHGN